MTKHTALTHYRRTWLADESSRRTCATELPLLAWWLKNWAREVGLLAGTKRSARKLVAVLSLALTACGGLSDPGPWALDHVITGVTCGTIRSTDTYFVRLHGPACPTDTECVLHTEQPVEVWARAGATEDKPFGASSYVQIEACN